MTLCSRPEVKGRLFSRWNVNKELVKVFDHGPMWSANEVSNNIHVHCSCQREKISSFLSGSRASSPATGLPLFAYAAFLICYTSPQCLSRAREFLSAGIVKSEQSAAKNDCDDLAARRQERERDGTHTSPERCFRLYGYSYLIDLARKDRKINF